MNETIINLINQFSNELIQIHASSEQVIFTSNNISHTIQFVINNDKLKLVNLDDSNYNTKQLVNILNSKFNDINDVPNIIDFITDVFTKILVLTNFCVICLKPLNFQSMTYISCGEKECLYKYEECIFGNIIIEKFRDNIDICLFLINSAMEAICSGRNYHIFEPFPTYFLKNQHEQVNRGTLTKLQVVKNNKSILDNRDKDKDFNKLTTIVNNYRSLDFIKIISTINNDANLMNIIGKDMYILLRFILLSCTCSIDLDKSDEIFGLKNTDMKIYKINSVNDVKFNVKKEKTSYLFHGSNWANWYSILRNGLKICSGSILMTAGQAYGPGIYLSDNSGLSFNYGKSGSTSVIGVYEVINAEKYHKGLNVFVVNDETQLLHKYLLIIPAKNQHLTEKINTAFLKTIHEEQHNTNQIYNKKCIMKIIKEYRLLKSKKDTNFRIDVNPEYPYIWKIFITKFEENLLIMSDMKKLNIKEIELELKFGNDYPFSPPFIRVVKPIFVPLSGHLTLHGAICHEILSNKGWVPTCSIEMLIQLVICEIGEDGRIDLINYNNSYDFKECKKSFDQMVVAQGWA